MYESGQQLAKRYVLKRPLSAGADAAIWLAVDSQRGNEVAIKFIESGAAAVREQQLLASLAHPGIRRALGLESDQDRFLLVLKYAPGGDLSMLRGAVWRTLVPRLCEVAEALEFLHRRHIVHGDVKTQNVLLEADGRALLSDFSTACPEGALRADGAARSPFTTSPQQRAGEPAAISDDVYAYGAMLYELLCGQPPNYASSESGAANAAPPQRVPSIHPVPNAIERICLACLDPQEYARPSGMSVILRSLQSVTLPPVQRVAGAARTAARKPQVMTPAAHNALLEPQSVTPEPQRVAVQAQSVTAEPQVASPEVRIVTTPPPTAAAEPQSTAAVAQNVPSEAQSVSPEVQSGIAEAPSATPAEQPAIPQGQSATTEAQSATTEAQSAPLLVPPVNASEVLHPSWRRDEETAPEVDVEQLRRQDFRRGMLVSGGVLLIVVTSALFWWPEQSAPTDAPSVAAPEVAPSDNAEQEAVRNLRELALIKTVVDDERAALGARWQRLLTGSVSKWGGAAAATAAQTLAEIDAQIAARDYRAAQAALQRFKQQVEALESARRAALADALKAGDEAIAAGISRAAIAAFALALEIQPDSAPAARGQKRAAVLDNVYGALTLARQAEQAGSRGEAIQQYRAALQLDALAPGAQAALARLGAQQADDLFGAAMAKVFSALGAGQLADARAALESARRIRPAAPELLAAEAQLNGVEQGGRLSTLLAEGQAAVQGERWAEAVARYQAALAIDASLSQARDSLSLAQSREMLDRELRVLTAQPERTYSAEVRQAADQVLARARAIASPGPLLQSQSAALEQVLRQADTPLPVALVSDNLTAVTIYRFGELGTFAERSLLLKPGSYTAVGQRTGYRDVRREIRVAPGRAGVPTRIECVEPI